ncbi:hypothetical protein [Kibdelosporangium phytohabitans]|uniref:Uncharacterized protein n=1 Tax=Kibdelosporangium phytohabitans TaxID=860235 RepID=A0A0N7F5D8_9PSEU|nr:hypothetical protein [Kibdelosporangium phytohabitans]ALG13951.1 hypothetical protein AOZ06_50100 [Kibdelosporangium phytohabitans]MBE1467107.1 hypothetical protein [Kibdelosporangium phytohabitans]
MTPERDSHGLTWSRDAIDRPLTWARRTAYWHAVDAARAAGAGPVELTDTDAAHHYDEDPVLSRESAARVRCLLADLPTRRREVFSWWLDGFDDQEIARDSGSVRRRSVRIGPLAEELWPSAEPVVLREVIRFADLMNVVRADEWSRRAAALFS